MLFLYFSSLSQVLFIRLLSTRKRALKPFIADGFIILRDQNKTLNRTSTFSLTLKNNFFHITFFCSLWKAISTIFSLCHTISNSHGTYGEGVELRGRLGSAPMIVTRLPLHLGYDRGNGGLGPRQRRAALCSFGNCNCRLFVSIFIISIDHLFLLHARPLTMAWLWLLPLSRGLTWGSCPNRATQQPVTALLSFSSFCIKSFCEIILHS